MKAMTTLLLLLMLFGPVAGTVTGSYSLAGLIVDASDKPPTPNSGFPITLTSSGDLPTLDAVWDFQYRQWVAFAFPEAPPAANYTLEIQFGTYDSDFWLYVTDCHGVEMVSWPSVVRYNTPEAAIAWFNYLKIELTGFCTDFFRIEVKSPYTPQAFMALSDIVSVWQIGVIDENYGVGVFRLPNNACDKGTFTACTTTLRSVDQAATAVAAATTPVYTVGQVSAGGFVGAWNSNAGPSYVYVDFSFLGKDPLLAGLKKPIIQLDCWNQFLKATVVWKPYAGTFPAGVIAPVAPAATDDPYYYLEIAATTEYLFGFPAVLTGLEKATSWKLITALSDAMISNFFRLSDNQYKYPLSVLVNNVPTTWAAADQTTTAFAALQYQSNTFVVPATTPAVVKPATSFFFFQWIDPAVSVCGDAFTASCSGVDQFWTSQPTAGQTAYMTFNIPSEVASYHCPWMSFYPTEYNWGPFKWSLVDYAGQEFMMEYMPYHFATIEGSTKYFSELFLQQTISLKGVATGPAKLKVISPRGVPTAVTPKPVFDVFPYFRFFDLRGPCGVPTCSQLLSHLGGTGSYFNQTCGATTNQRQLLVADLNNTYNRNCSVKDDNVNYAFVDVDNTRSGAWVNPFGVPIQVIDWGTADWGVVTSFLPVPESYVSLGITPVLGNYVGDLDFLFLLSKGNHNGTLNNSPTTFIIVSHRPIVNVLVFTEENRNGILVESIPDASFTPNPVAEDQYVLVLPGNCYAVAGYLVGPGPSPDDGSDEALLGLLGLLAVPFLALSLSMACAWWFLSRPKVPPPMPVEYYPMPVQETLYWTEAPPLVTNPVAYPGTVPFGVAPIPSPVW